MQRLNRHVKILLLGANIWYLGEGMLGPLFAVFSERLGGSVLDITWAWSTYLIIAGLCNIAVGKFSDGHASKAKLMVAGYSLNALCTFGYLLVSEPQHLFFVQMGLGVSAALSGPTWAALYAHYEDKKQDGFEWGLASGQANIVTGIAIIIGGLLVNYASFKVLFTLMGTIQVVAAIVQSNILRLPARERR